MTDEERLVVRRLADGLTDNAIAAREPVSPRTIQRVVAKLADAFGARSRFAIGVEVGRRGLLERAGE